MKRLENLLCGSLIANGVFEDMFGIIRRKFTVHMHGTWNNDDQTFSLRETFLFDDGEQETRLWSLHKDAMGYYRGKAKHVVGEAKGHMNDAGEFHLTYVYALPLFGRKWRVKFEDIITPLPDGTTLFNRAVIRKWGITIGRVNLTIQPGQTAPAPI